MSFKFRIKKERIAMSVLKRSFSPRHFLDLVADYAYVLYDDAAATHERKQTKQMLQTNNVPRVFIYDLPMLLSEALISKRHTLRSIFVIVSTEAAIQTVQSNQFVGLDYKVLTDAEMLRVLKNCESFVDDLKAKTSVRIGTLSEIMIHRLKHITLVWAAKFGSAGTKNFYTDPALHTGSKAGHDMIKKAVSGCADAFTNYHGNIVSSLASLVEQSGYAPTVPHSPSNSALPGGSGADVPRPLSTISSSILSTLQHLLSTRHQSVAQHVTEVSSQAQKQISASNQAFQTNVLSLINQILNTTVGGGWPMLSLHIQDFFHYFAPKNIDATMEYNTSGISNGVVLLHYFADRLATVYEPVTLSLDLCDDPTNAWFYVNEIRPMYSLQVDNSPCGRLLIRGDYTSQTSCILQDKYLLSGATDLATTYRQYEAYIAKAVHALSQLLVSAWKHSLRAQKLIVEEIESLKSGRVSINYETFRHIIAGHTIDVGRQGDKGASSEVPGSNGAATNPFIGADLPSNSLAYALHHTTFVTSFSDLILLLAIRLKSPSPDSTFNLTVKNIGGPAAPIVTVPTGGAAQGGAAKWSYAYMRRLYITQADMDNYVTTIAYLTTLPFVILNEFLDYMAYLNQKSCQENFSRYRQAVVLTEKMGQFCAQNGLSETVLLYIQKILDADCDNMAEDFILANQVALNSISWRIDGLVDGFVESYLALVESTVADDRRVGKNVFGSGAPQGVSLTTSGLTRLYTYRFLHLLRQSMTPRPGAEHDATSIMDFDEQILLSKSPYHKVQPSIALYTQSPDCPSLKDDVISIRPLSNAITYQLFIPVSGRNRTTFEQLISLADFMSLVARFNPFPHRSFTHTLIFNTSLGLNNLFYPYHLKGAIANDYQRLELSARNDTNNANGTNTQGTILAHFLTSHVPAMSQFSPALVNGGGGPGGTCNATSKANFALLIDFYNNVNLTYNLTYNSLNREKYNRVRVEEDRTGGDCAVCNVKYDNYRTHVSSAEHLKNYKSYMAQVSGLTENGESNAMIDELRYLSLQFERISAIGVQLSSIIITIAAELGCTYEFVAGIINDLLKSLCGDLVIDVSDIPRALSPNCKTNTYLKWREDNAHRRQLSFEQFLTGSGSRKTGYKRIKASAGSILLTGIMLDVNRVKWVRNSIMARCCGVDIHTYMDALVQGKDSGVSTSISGASSINKVSIDNNGSYYLFPKLPSEQEYTIPKLIIDPRTHTQFLFEEEDFTQLIRVSMATVLWRAYGGSISGDSSGAAGSAHLSAGLLANVDKQRAKGQQAGAEQVKFGSHMISMNKSDYVLPAHLQHKSTSYLATYESDDELDLQQEHVVRRLCDETPFLSGSRYIHVTAELKYHRYERYRARISCRKQEAREEDPNLSVSAGGADYETLNPDLNVGLSSGSPTIKQRQCYHVTPITGLDFKLLRQDIIDVEVGHIPQTGMLVKLAKNILEIREQRHITDAELIEMAKTVFGKSELDDVFTATTAEWLRARLENPATAPSKSKETRTPQASEDGADEETSNELNTYDARLSGTSRLQIPRLYWYDHANGRMFVDGFNDLENEFIQQSHISSGFDIGRVNAIEFSRAYAKSIEKSLLSGQSEITFVERNADGVVIDRNAYESTDHTLLSGLMGGPSAQSTLEQASRVTRTANVSAASRHHSAMGSALGGTSMTGYGTAGALQKNTFNYNDNIKRILTAIPAAKIDISLLSSLAAIPLDILRAICTNCINLMQASDVILAINNLGEVTNVIPDEVIVAISKSLDAELHCFTILSEPKNAAKVYADHVSMIGRSRRANSAVESAIIAHELSGAGTASGFVEDTVKSENANTGLMLSAAALADEALDAYFETVSQQVNLARSSSCQDFFAHMKSFSPCNPGASATEQANRYPSNSILRAARANSVAAPRRIRLEEDMISIQLLGDEIGEALPTTSLIEGSTLASHLITTGDPKNLNRYSVLKESTILERGIEDEHDLTYIPVNGQQVLMVSHYAAPIMSNFNAIDPNTAYFSKKYYGKMIPTSESICSAVYSSLIPSYTGTSRFLEQVSDLWKGSADAFLGSCASVSSVYNDQTFYSIKILDPSTTTLISLAARAEVLRRKAELNAPGFNTTKGLVELRHDCRSLWRSTGAKPIVVLDRSDRGEFLGTLGLSDSDGEDADYDEISALGPFDVTQSGKPDIYATHTYQFMN